MKIYVKDAIRKPSDTLYTFLERLLKLNTSWYIRGTCKSSYYDPELKSVQCSENRYRSFDDIVLISKTYFKVSDKAVAKVIKRILDNYNSAVFVLCDTANKWILYYGLNKSDSIKYCANYNKSYNKIDDSRDGIYSFIDIITLMGLTKEDVEIN